MTIRTALSAFIAFAACVAAALPAQAQTLIRDAEIEALMREYSDPLLAAAGLRPEDVDIHLVADRSMNAFVAGGQNMFLNTGIILAADKPNELKGVIAHETAHIAAGHLRRRGEAESRATSTMLVTLGAGLLAALAGAPDAGAALMASSQQFAFTDIAKFSREVEASADQAALGYLNATQQSPEGLVTFFERFRSQEVLRDQRFAASPYFRTHPMSSQRISALRQRVRSSPFYGDPTPEEELARFRLIQGKIHGFLSDPNTVLTIYPEDDQSMPARYARSVAHFRAGSLDKAIGIIDAMIAERPDYPFFHELKGQMYYESGKIEESIQPYRRALELYPESTLLETGLSGSLIQAGDPQLRREGISRLKLITFKEKDNAFAWRLLSRAYEEEGERALAQYASAEHMFQLGNFPRAAQFAYLAREELPQGSREWLLASDILTQSEREVRNERERR